MGNDKRVRELDAAGSIHGSHYVPVDTGSGSLKRATISEVIGASHTAGGIFDPADRGFAPTAAAAVNRAALRATIEAAPAGSTILLRAGSYNLDDGFFIEKPLTIRGDGQVTLRFVGGGTVTNQNAFWFRSPMDGNSASAAVYGPLGGVTYYRTFSGAVAEGARTFTLASVTGLAVGTEVMLLLGADPYDATQPFLRMFNRVAGISGSDVTFSLAVPEDVNGTSHKCVTFGALVENCGVENITIATDGAFTMEVALWFDKCRNVHARDLDLSGLPRGLVVEASDNVTLENITAKSITQYSLLGGFGFTNLHARNLSVDDSYSTAVYFESQARGALLENVRIGRGATANNGAASVIINGGCVGVLLKNFHLTHAVACSDATFNEGASVRTEDWFLWNSEYHRSFPLAQHSGLLYHNEQLYSRVKRFSRRFPLYDGMPLDIGLPTGVYKDVRVFVTNTSALTLFMPVAGGNGVNITSLLSANALVRPATESLTYIGKDADYPFNNTDAKTTQVQCSGMAAGNYGMIEIEYYESPASDDDTQRGAAQALPIIIKTATWDPGNLSDGASAQVGIGSITGAKAGDPVTVGFSSMPNNGMWQLSAQITSDEFATVVMTNHTGGSVDLGSGTVRLIVWKLVG